MATAKKKAGKIVAIVIAAVLVLIILLVSIVYGVFFNEFNAVFSIKKVDDNVYKMSYNNSYYFDDFMESGAKNDDELIEFIIGKLLKGLPIEIKIPSMGCSTFTATTEGGEKIFARNYDLRYSPIMILKTNPKNGYKSISTVDLTVLGYSFDYLPESLFDKLLTLASPYVPIDGMNEKGLTISVNMLHGDVTTQNTGKTGITTTTMIRMVLDKAATVDEAIELISKYDMYDSVGGPYHFQISDATGKSVIVEYVNNVMKLTNGTSNYQVMTNFMISSDGVSDEYGRDRYDIVDKYLANSKGIASEAQAMDLLSQVVMNWTADNGGKAGTMWSNVYNRDKLTMTFTPYQKYGIRHEFKL